MGVYLQGFKPWRYTPPLKHLFQTTSPNTIQPKRKEAETRLLTTKPKNYESEPMKRLM